MKPEQNEGDASPPHLEYGMRSIAEFFSLPLRKAYYLAPKGYLPGVFKMGERSWAFDKEIAREGLRSRAKGGA
jgi:hypothetical protein